MEDLQIWLVGTLGIFQSPNLRSTYDNSYDSELRIPVSSGISGMDDLELVEELLLNNLFIVLD